MKLIDAEFLKNKVKLMDKSESCTLGERAILWQIERMIDDSPQELAHVGTCGAWIVKRNNGNIPYRECSKCGGSSVSTAKSAKFCQYCGSYNDVEIKEADK